MLVSLLKLGQRLVYSIFCFVTCMLRGVRLLKCLALDGILKGVCPCATSAHSFVSHLNAYGIHGCLNCLFGQRPLCSNVIQYGASQRKRLPKDKVIPLRCISNKEVT